MNNPDFDFKKFVEVPDAWIENALNIPNTAPKTPKVTPFLRYAVSAAGIVLVTALSVGLYFVFRNKSPIPVAPFTPTQSTEAITENNTTATAEPTSSGSTEKLFTVPTEPATQLATDQKGRVITVTVTTPASEAPTDAASPVSPTQRATEAPTSRPTNPPSPTKPAPTVPAPTASPATQPPTDSHLSGEKQDADVIEIYAPVYLIPSNKEIDGYFYCCVYDENGQPIGDSDLYSPTHRMLYHADKLYYAVERPQYPDVAADGEHVYAYQIYLSNGTTMESGTVV